MTSAPSITAADLERTERYLALDPHNPILLATAVDMALALGLADKARQHIDLALRIAPQDAFMRNRLGNVLLAQGSLDEAELVFTQLLREHSDANVAYNLAVVHSRKGDHQRARELLASIVDAPGAPSGAAALHLRSLHHLGETALAMQIAHAHLANAGGDVEYLAVASLVALDEDRMDEAAQWSARALCGVARPVEALVAAGSVALARENVQLARTFFNEALALRPLDGRTWAGLGTASLLLGDAPTAKNQFERALAAMPKNGEVLQSLGWSSVMMAQTHDAEVAFKQAAEVDGAASEPLGGLATVYAIEGRHAEAEDHIARARRIAPGDPGAHLAAAILAGEIGENDKLMGRVIARGTRK